MKKALLHILLLFSVAGFAQIEKDSLLVADKEAILDKLDLMFYLDQVATEYWKMTKEQQVESNKIFPYYFVNTIVKNNPSSIDLKQFIDFDFKEYKPIKWKDFLGAVYEKNITEFIALTEKYGYLSNKRLNRLKDGKASGLVVFVIRSDNYDKQIKQLMKKEFKNGNMPQIDYDQIKFFLQRKTVYTEQDIAKMEKKGIRMIKENR